MAKTRETFALDLLGQAFGKWTVLCKADRHGAHGEIYWVCKCACGTERAVSAQSLRNGTSVSCGRGVCGSRFSHGMEGTRLYNTWSMMLTRCSNQKSVNWHLYGGRGIKVCERWRSFENFYADMGDKPEGKTLDRFPNRDGNYEPGNVRWATGSQQARNKRSSPIIEWNGQMRSLADLAEEHGMKWRQVYERVRQGWSVKDALTIKRANAWSRGLR